MPDTTAVPTENVLILSCPDQRGIVATVTALLFEHGANIEESQQFLDVRTNQFFMRIRFSVDIGGAPTPRWRELFAPVATDYGMDWSIRDAATPYRALADGQQVRSLPQRPAVPLAVRGSQHGHPRRRLEPP